MIPTNPELINIISDEESLVEVRLDITRSAAYLISEEGYEMELLCDSVVELHQLGSLIQQMTEGTDVKVYWRCAISNSIIEHS